MQNKVVVVVAGYSISLIRDPERGTSQFYLRVAWTSAFKRLFLVSCYYGQRVFTQCLSWRIPLRRYPLY